MAEEKAYMNDDGLAHLLEKFAKENPVKAEPLDITGEYFSGTAGPSIELSGGSIATVTAVSNDTSVITVSVNGTTIDTTVTGEGNTTIIISVTSKGYYNNKNIVIPVAITAKDYVSWANGTDEEIAIMVQMADNGEIDLYEDAGWRVGDERQVSLSAIAASGSYDGVSWSVGETQNEQTATLVLLDRGSNQNFTLVNPVKNKDGSTRTKPSFIYGLKNSLVTPGYMNPTNTNSGSWSGSHRRDWCNSGFRQAMPSALRSVSKKFNLITAETYNGSTNQTSQDYFALAAAKEIFGGSASSAGSDTGYSNLTEFNALKQFKYYEASANRIKKLGDGGSAGNWLERSPNCDDSAGFCRVNSSGNAYNSGASNTRGLAPFGCL